MTIVNHENYVSLEVAKLLKEAGFDWGSNAIYGSVGGEFNFYYGIPKLINKNSDEYSAPTLEVAQRWLREVKRINVEVMYLFEPCNYYFARACSLDTNTPLYIPNPPASTIYEEALEAGIKKALEIILDKNEV